MKRLSIADFLPGSSRLGTPLLLCLYTIIILAIVPPLIEPRIQSWLTGNRTERAVAATDEPWPTPPAAYVAPAVGPAQAARAVPTPAPLPAPVWRELSYLVSVEFKTSSVVHAERESNVAILGNIVTDRLIMKAVGNVQIGIDLNRVSDVQIAGKSIRFTVPPPQITSVELLPNESQVYERQQVIFLSQYAGLETEAFEAARQQLRAEVSAKHHHHGTGPGTFSAPADPVPAKERLHECRDYFCGRRCIISYDNSHISSEPARAHHHRRELRKLSRRTTARRTSRPRRCAPPTPINLAWHPLLHGVDDRHRYDCHRCGSAGQRLAGE